MLFEKKSALASGEVVLGGHMGRVGLPPRGKKKKKNPVPKRGTPAQVRKGRRRYDSGSQWQKRGNLSA